MNLKVRKNGLVGKFLGYTFDDIPNKTKTKMTTQQNKTWQETAEKIAKAIKEGFMSGIIDNKSGEESYSVNWELKAETFNIKKLQKYKVIWKVSKYAYIKAENEEDAIHNVMETDVERFEDKIIEPPSAYQVIN